MPIRCRAVAWALRSGGFRSNEFERRVTQDDTECGEAFERMAARRSKYEADLRGRVITITDNRTVVAHRPSRRRQIDKYTRARRGYRKTSVRMLQPTRLERGMISILSLSLFAQWSDPFFLFITHGEQHIELYQWLMTNRRWLNFVLKYKAALAWSRFKARSFCFDSRKFVLLEDDFTLCSGWESDGFSSKIIKIQTRVKMLKNFIWVKEILT